MIDLHYNDSLLIRTSDRAAGLRLPNPMLQTQDGKGIRLYNLVPNDAFILEVTAQDKEGANLPVENVIRIGQGGYHDPAGIIRKLLGNQDGWILVRPDTHIAWARTSLTGMEEAVRYALGR